MTGNRFSGCGRFAGARSRALQVLFAFLSFSIVEHDLDNPVTGLLSSGSMPQTPSNENILTEVWDNPRRQQTPWPATATPARGVKRHGMTIHYTQTLCKYSVIFLFCFLLIFCTTRICALNIDTAYLASIHDYGVLALMPMIAQHPSFVLQSILGMCSGLDRGGIWVKIDLYMN